MRCPKGLWPLGLKNKHCWTRARQSQTSITRTVPLKITPTVFSIEHGYYREIPGKVHWELTADDDQDNDSTVLLPNSLYRAARLQTSNGVFCSVNHLSGGEVSVNHNATHSPSLAP